MPSDSTPSTDYTSEPQQTVLIILETLARAFPQALTAKAMAIETGLSRDQAFRCLWNLRRAGWAEQIAAGWCLSPHAAQLSERVRLAIHRLHTTYLESAA
jgi:DNA-binding IclR family transcriptional regulator